MFSNIKETMFLIDDTTIDPSKPSCFANATGLIYFSIMKKKLSFSYLLRR
jgi:hypothetical protein